MNMTPKVIIHNGPPSSGKDVASTTITKYLNHQGVHARHEEFKGQLFRLTRAIYGIPVDVWDKWYTREGKELPREELGGLSCRGALIHVSEDVIKPNFGKKYFGEFAAKYDADVVSFSDGGFVDEIYPLIEKYGRENVLVVRIHREGYTFEGDSRSYLPDGVVEHMIDITNHMPVENNDREFNDFKQNVTYADMHFIRDMLDSDQFILDVTDSRSDIKYTRFPD